MSQFRKAERKNIFARVALCGPAGSGKTFTALMMAQVLAAGGNVAAIDTERRSTERYADEFSFDICELSSFSAENYLSAIREAKKEGYAALVVDSLSHAWEGKDGILELVDNISKRKKAGNSFAAWGDATPIHRQLIEEILSFPGHVIVTMRSKTEYVQEKDSKGKTTIRKVGMAPVQRAGLEYEFDIVGDMDFEHELVITKSRAKTLADRVVRKPGIDFAKEVLDWALGGKPGEDPVNCKFSEASSNNATQEPDKKAQDATLVASLHNLIKENFKGAEGVAKYKAVLKDHFGVDSASKLDDDGLVALHNMLSADLSEANQANA